ncbi:P-loop containing nucleoside triphosphate hydrolase protein [Gonapodya prolifera JEL478]|uniref:p-loop containing nucleoside triphosphate hydrolase protein n=1 Tax=Gonapodya prolifera (strain JEL478) TaxID=1344416 RepID=A0A139A3V2_GONPJ|nr:P-loop containing nucleoside triphosphate hydrolase protein [Gonapodya prolifera JEL478]|eukprot:KXS11145.1 P-loop containing nucleoside triphosphate hydrolase protein [Gonapodya prolifera JEL478]
MSPAPASLEARPTPSDVPIAIPTYRTFVMSPYIGLDEDRSCGDLDVFKVLRDKAGLSTAVPLDADLEAEKVDINDVAWWHTRFEGPHSWPFVWEGVQCDIDFIEPGEAHRNRTGGVKLIIRVHDMTEGVAERVLTEIGNELAARWTDPFHPEGKTVIHRAEKRGSNPYFWNTLMKRDSRDLATVYLDTAQKDRLVKGLEFFLANKALYDRTGVTWKRIHLLHGPPGTGKTSICLAIAGYFKRDIARLAITGDLKATDLEYLLSNMPSKAFLLLEDVDALFAHGRESKTNVDFSTLINAMDGIATKKGMVVFMTTNHLAKLDPALIRPGRVDFCMEVRLPSREAILEALGRLAPEYASEHAEFADRYAKGLTIAAIQKHVFDCLVEGRASMLSEVEVLAPLGKTESRSSDEKGATTEANKGSVNNDGFGEAGWLWTERTGVQSQEEGAE